MENYRIVITHKSIDAFCKAVNLNDEQKAALFKYRDSKSGKSGKSAEDEKLSCRRGVHIFHDDNKKTNTYEESCAAFKKLSKEEQQKYTDRANAENMEKNKGKGSKSPAGKILNPKTGRYIKIKPETVSIVETPSLDE